MLSDGTEMPYELFLGVPVHRVPQVVVESGLAADAYGWVPVNKKTLETNFPGVYAVGDVNGVGTAKAGVFAEGAARVVAAGIIAQLRGGPVTGGLQRGWLLLCGVRPRPGRKGSRGLSERPKTCGHLPRGIRGTRRRESSFRIQPAPALVRTTAVVIWANRTWVSLPKGDRYGEGISLVAVTRVLIATFRPGVRAWTRSCNFAPTTVPRNTT